MTKIALVTGANRGLGYETCRQLALRGLEVVLTSRNISDGREAVARLHEMGVEVAYHALDVSDPGQVLTLQRDIEREFGRLDILVNNAGVYLDERMSVFDVPLDVVRRTMEVNFYGPLMLCRAFIPMMRRNGYGRIVNVSSDLGSLSQMGGAVAAYRISKAALNALTRIMAAELTRTNIKVNSVSPGWVRTDMGGPAASRSVEQGAQGIVWLATLPEDGPTGGFYRDKRALDW